jgi:uncharacterized protein (UPF0335 family)
MTDTFPKTHNSDPRQQVKLVADRIVRLTQERDAISTDIKELYIEAKSVGLPPRVLRAAVRLSMMTKQDRDNFYESEDLRDTYVAAIT